jgi:soluble lytic murein transglycosylase
LAPATPVRWYKTAALSLLPALAAYAQTAQPLADAVRAYEEGRYEAAVSRLESVKIARLADYTAYYRGAARAELGALAAALKDLGAVRAFQPRSPLAGNALVREAELLTSSGKPAEGIRLILDRYAELPQPDADLAAAKAYETAGDDARAVDYYQRVFYRYPAGDPAMQAASALASLKSSMGESFPAANPALQLVRAQRLIALRDYSRAKTELQELASHLTGVERDSARVRLGAIDYSRGAYRDAYRYLKALDVTGEAEAERLFYLAECARRAGDDEEMLDHLKRLGKKHEFSPWRLKALMSAAGRFLVANDQDRYEDLYRAAYEGFPETADGAYAHWKVAWLHYLRRKRDADDRMRAQLERFPSYNATAAAYFLGRLAETGQKYDEARAYFAKIVECYPNYYYGVLARGRFQQPKVIGATTSARIAQYLDGLTAFRPDRQVSPVATAATRARTERARLLHAAGLGELAEAELRFGSRDDAQPIFMALERARMEESPFEALRAIKRLAPAYLSMEVDQAPKEFWRYLFPLPYRTVLVRHARAQDLDPHMVAALIRQESEFNPRARSRANALGLTQVLPGTGRQLARRVGLRRFSAATLYQPEPNLRIGTYYLRSLLDRWGGKWEETLASYNAGPSRAADWVTWAEFREPAEFVETVPFTETREYIQAVTRNASLYRQIYRDGIPGEPAPAKMAAAKRPVKKAAPGKRKAASAAVSRKTRTAAKTGAKKSVAKAAAPRKNSRSAAKKTSSRSERAQTKSRGNSRT